MGEEWPGNQWARLIHTLVEGLRGGFLIKLLGPKHGERNLSIHHSVNTEGRKERISELQEYSLMSWD